MSGGSTCALALTAAVMLIASSRPTSAQDCMSGATFSGPITITSGGTYTGNWQSLDPATPVVQIFTAQPVTIINSRLRGPGDLLISGHRVNVTVQESCFVGTYPTAAGTGKGHAIHLFQPANVVIEHNDFDAVGGYNQGTATAGSAIWVQQYLGDGTLNNTIKIRYNRLHNLDGRFSDGRGGYLTTATSQWSNGIHPSDMSGVPGIEIAWNQIINEPYQSGIGDSINIFDASGTSASPMQVHDNYIQGGWDSDPANGNGFRYYGSAITTDGFFQTDPRLTIGFVKIHDNQAVGFGNSGWTSGQDRVRRGFPRAQHREVARAQTTTSRPQGRPRLPRLQPGDYQTGRRRVPVTRGRTAATPRGKSREEVILP